MNKRNKKVFFDSPIQVTGDNFTLNEIENENDNLDNHPTILPTQGFIIPFFRGEHGTALLVASGGFSTAVCSIGFGSASGLITLTTPSTSPSYTQNSSIYCYSFIMPYTANLKAISFTTYTYDGFVAIFPTGASFTPYVTLYTAPSGTTTFTPLMGTKVSASQGYDSNPSQSSATSGYQGDLNVEIQAGTRVAIVQGFDEIGTTNTVDGWCEMGGALFFSDN